MILYATPRNSAPRHATRQATESVAQQQQCSRRTSITRTGHRLGTNLKPPPGSLQTPAQRGAWRTGQDTGPRREGGREGGRLGQGEILLRSEVQPVVIRPRVCGVRGAGCGVSRARPRRCAVGGRGRDDAPLAARCKQVGGGCVCPRPAPPRPTLMSGGVEGVNVVESDFIRVGIKG